MLLFEDIFLPLFIECFYEARGVYFAEHAGLVFGGDCFAAVEAVEEHVIM